MGLKIETWSIAYRKRGKGLFDKNIPFKVIKNGYKGWYADPFLFDYEGETYLFAEYFSYVLNRGVLVYSKFDNHTQEFDSFKEIINEEFHLSYPVVYEYKGQIYMMPESNESDSLFMYRAISFPDKWERLPAVMNNIKLVDTTPFVKNGILYALTLRLDKYDHSKGDLLLLEFDGEKFNVSSQGVLSKDMSLSRPGGHFVEFNDGLYRISQDCNGSYGKAVNIIKVNEKFFYKYEESLVEKIQPDNIKLTNGSVPSGIHTYNISEKIEVVDLKYYKNSFYHIFAKIFHHSKGVH